MSLHDESVTVFSRPSVIAPPIGTSEREAIFAFGRYRLFPHWRLLLAEAEPIELGSRAFEVLLTLVEAGGELVTKDELRKRVWPCTAVAPHSLDTQIRAVRKALGTDRELIQTEPGRGYRFATPVTTISSPPIVAPTTNLPSPVTPLVGRSRELVELQDLIARHRLVTLTGGGGIGKTQLGLEAARQALPGFSGGCWVVELAPLVDPGLVPALIARTFGIDLSPHRSAIDQLTAALHRGHLLLVLDNCEHVIEPVAEIAEGLLHGAPRLHVLATSQEPLMAEGEHVFHVAGLRVPSLENVSVEQAMAHSAVRLFVKRACAADPMFSLDDRVVPAVTKICRHLDGNPLAIELAAARVATIGVTVLAERLDDRFRLLTGGRRKALKRHQTLGAVFDWSYGLLAETERAVLRRVAIFAGSFTFDSAGAVAAADGIDPSLAANHIAALVSKSLVAFDNCAPLPRYHLLDTTRAYVLQKLVESGEFERVARRHAEFYRARLEGAMASWQTAPTAELAARYTPELDDIRAALHWAFEPDGDAHIGVALAAAAAPLWILMSTLSAYRDLIGRALEHLDRAASEHMRHEMRLQGALAFSSMWADGPIATTYQAAERALKLAEDLEDSEYQLRALFILWLYRLRIGEYRAALALAQQFRQLAERGSDLPAIVEGVFREGVSLFHLGDYGGARAAAERVLADPSPDICRSMAARFVVDQRVAALVYLVRILWLQGFPDQAARLMQAVIAESRTSNANELCLVLCDAACGIAALSGDGRAVEDFSTTLTDCAEKHGLGMWRALGFAFKGVAAIKRGDGALGLRLLRGTLDGTDSTHVEFRHTIFVQALTEALIATGRLNDGIALVQKVLDESRRNEGHWCVPELLRLRGELTLREGRPTSDAASMKDFTEAIAMAGRQGARLWQLRAAVSLARLRHRQGRRSEARSALVPVYEWFSEGFETADLKAARALIDELE